jgi:hypothetical protein
MKRFIAVILALVYLSASSGAMLHLHYCMGQLVSWGLIDKESKTCDYCGMPKSTSHEHTGIAKSNCCKDEHKQIKTERDQKTVSSGLELVKPVHDASVNEYAQLNSVSISSVTIAHPNINGPPRSLKVALFLRNCDFRI